MKSIKSIVSVLLTLCMVFSMSLAVSADTSKVKVTLDNLPKYSDSAYVELYNNKPQFTKSEKRNKKAFENYSELDDLGRCGIAFANICTELMPTEDRGAIGMVKPSGWQTVKYNGLVDGNYLYNRCHLIGFQLAGENANEKNLITGTRYLNIEGMLSFENKVADYIKTNKKNHVLYRVTPVFDGDNLVASGVQIEAYSVEDKGKGVSFNVYCYNVQPGVIIDYSSGKSQLDENSAINICLNYKKYALNVGKTLKLKATVEPEDTKAKITWYSSNQKVAKVSSKGVVTALKAGTATITAKTDNGLKATCKITVKNNSVQITAPSGGKTNYVLNTSTHKFHKPSCSSVGDMSAKNRQDVTWTRDEVISHGYVPCKRCNP